MKVTVIAIRSFSPWDSSQEIVNDTRWSGDKRKDGNHPDHGTRKIGETSVKENASDLLVTTHKEGNINEEITM